MSGKERERGALGQYSVEAALTLFPFVLAFLSILLLVSAVRTETAVRFALDQTAKEISQYCYLAGKAKQLSGYGSKDAGTSEGEKEAEELLSAFSEFSSMFGRGKDIPSSGADLLSDVLDALGNAEGNYLSVVSSAENLSKKLSAVADDPGPALSAVAGALFRTGIADAAGRAAAIPLCRMIMPKYLTGSGGAADADAELRRMGVEGGLDGLDFGLSSILTDGRSVNLVAFYRIKLFDAGFFKGEIRVSQTASTAAWLPDLPEDPEAEKDDGSVWRLDNFTRGKFFVAEIKSENPSDAIKGGKGIDLYDLATSVFTSVISLNSFGATYSDFTPPPEGKSADAENYRLKEGEITKGISKAATKLKKSISALKKGDLLEREIGGKIGPDLKGYTARVTVIFPEEAKIYSDLIESAAEKAGKKTGTTVMVEYRYKALVSAEPDSGGEDAGHG